MNLHLSPHSKEVRSVQRMTAVANDFLCASLYTGNEAGERPDVNDPRSNWPPAHAYTTAPKIIDPALAANTKYLVTGEMPDTKKIKALFEVYFQGEEVVTAMAGEDSR